MIHQTLKEIRKEKGLTLQEVSEKTNRPLRPLERIESGETRLDLERLEMLSQAYEISSPDVLARDRSGIQFNIDKSHVYSGVAYQSVFHNSEKDLYEKLLQAKDQVIEAQKREIELLKKNEIEADRL